MSLQNKEKTERMKKFVNIIEDQYAGKKVFTSNEIRLDCKDPSVQIFLKVKREKNTSGTDILTIELRTLCGDWLELEKGKFLVSIDGETISPAPHESLREMIYGGICSEREYYVIDKGMLEKLGKSKLLEMKIAGDSMEFEVLNGNEIVELAKFFFSEVYDRNAFKDEDENSSKPITENSKEKYYIFMLIVLILLVLALWFFR